MSFLPCSLLALPVLGVIKPTLCVVNNWFVIITHSPMLQFFLRIYNYCADADHGRMPGYSTNVLEGFHNMHTVAALRGLLTYQQQSLTCTRTRPNRLCARFGYPTAIQETLGRELTAVDGNPSQVSTLNSKP